MKPQETFRHVQSELLRHTLRKDPRQVTRPELQSALSYSFEALGRDAVDASVPNEAFEARRDAMRQAECEFLRRHNAKAARCLQRYWSI